MVLIAVCAFSGIVAGLAALAVQFSLPMWPFLAGLSRLNEEQRTRVHLHKLRRRVSILYYVLSAGFMLSSLLLAVKAVSFLIIYPALVSLLIAIFNILHFIIRRFDSNEYSVSERRGKTLVYALCNLVLLFFLVVSLPV